MGGRQVVGVLLASALMAIGPGVASAAGQLDTGRITYREYLERYGGRIWPASSRSTWRHSILGPWLRNAEGPAKAAHHGLFRVARPIPRSTHLKPDPTYHAE